MWGTLGVCDGVDLVELEVEGLLGGFGGFFGFSSGFFFGLLLFHLLDFAHEDAAQAGGTTLPRNYGQAHETFDTP